MAAVADRADNDTAVILYTSGTTGGRGRADPCQPGPQRGRDGDHLLRLEPGDVVMGCPAAVPRFGQTCGLNAAVGAEASLTLLARFD